MGEAIKMGIDNGVWSREQIVVTTKIFFGTQVRQCISIVSALVSHCQSVVHVQATCTAAPDSRAAAVAASSCVGPRICCL